MRAVASMFFFTLICSIAACSAENNQTGGGAGVGAAATGGSSGIAGGGGQMGGSGGQIAGASGYSASGGTAAQPPGGTGGTDDVCASQSVVVDRTPANVMLVVDRSSSMILNQFGNANRWDALYDALMAQPGGLVPNLEAGIRFGFSSYTNYAANGTACPDLVTVFPPAFNNFANISANYVRSNGAMGGPMPNAAILLPVGETPTGEALTLILDQLLPWAAPGGPDVESLGPVVVLLATDGEPDSCADISQDTELRNDPARQMVVDQVIRAFGAGVQTYVLSVGVDVGDQHLQAVANAGVGAAAGANAPFWKADNPQGLEDAIAQIIGNVMSCELELQGKITNEVKACQPGVGKVVLDGTDLICGDPNGWRVVDATHIELMGDACNKFKIAATAVLDASFPCDVVTID